MHPAHKHAVRKGCVLAFFSVVASYSNLSTYRFSGAKIVLVEKVDKSLMGGIVLRYSDTEIDGSVRTRLDDIKAQIDGVIA